MFLKNYYMTFILSLITGTVMAVSSNSWFTSWVGLEINLMSMIPLMLISLKKNFTEAAIKYFLAQALGSVFLIFTITVNFFFSELFLLEMTEVFLITSLSLKAGLAPFHYWFPQVSNLLDWSQCLIIFTWQKIAPLLLFISMNLKMIFFISMTSAMIGAMGGLNQNFTKLVMAYSSISHAGWLVIGCSLSTNTLISYFLIYSFLSLTIVNFFFNNQIMKIKQIFSCSDSNFNKNILILNFLSLGGIPPLLGFLAKLTILSTAIKFNVLIIFIPLISASLISLFFYTRLIYSNLLNRSPKNLNFSLMKKSPKSFLFSTSIFMNTIFPLLILLT
uniref:NADH-ubiquinone oxidoreductase chain 2 n=1 Tax=Homidia sp. TaxID=3054010 RepID=A0AAU6PTE2_9HEXA